MRLAIVNLLPTPYRDPVYRCLDQTPAITLRVFYLQPSDTLRGWWTTPRPYDAVRVGCLTPERLYSIPFFGVVNPGLTAHLRRFSPDCLVIHGYSYLSQLQAMRWAIRRGVPYLLWGDSNAAHLRSAGVRSAVKRRVLRYFCRHAAGVLSIGSSNEEFWRHYGVAPQRLFRSPLAVDNDFFASQAAHWRARRPEERRRLGLPDGRLALYAGRFAGAKNLPALLDALALRRRAGDHSLSLVLAGDGPDRARIEQRLRQLDLRGVFRFGFLPQAELAKLYGLCDFLVLPSLDEPWGLVVNEAMAAGLPVLVSRSAGCRPDLLEEGVNGFSFDERDPAALAECLEQMSRLSDDRLWQMGARSAQRIAGWSFSAALDGIYRALDAVGAGWRAHPVEAARPA